MYNNDVRSTLRHRPSAAGYRSPTLPSWQSARPPPTQDHLITTRQLIASSKIYKTGEVRERRARTKSWGEPGVTSPPADIAASRSDLAARKMCRVAPAQRHASHARRLLPHHYGRGALSVNARGAQSPVPHPSTIRLGIGDYFFFIFPLLID
ncbi:hypothetical protein EVAR_33393_1 [Eumeta japonica]|uniref:Uncharacterized protein n=1 Tax=Eumeta variegata TaxID=151549 RepID=A0A4C1W0B4_EUMVA|nr:hypothetical protein EVAR_33393_1 [Eumeta japonica]